MKKQHKKYIWYMCQNVYKKVAMKKYIAIVG